MRLALSPIRLQPCAPEVCKPNVPLPAPSLAHYKRMPRIGTSSTLGAEVNPLLLESFTRNVACHTPRPKMSAGRRTHTAAPSQPSGCAGRGARGEARGARRAGRGGGGAGVPATLIAAMVESKPTKTKASLLSAPLICACAARVWSMGGAAEGRSSGARLGGVARGRGVGRGSRQSPPRACRR
jgi:hypothetical protein